MPQGNHYRRAGRKGGETTKARHARKGHFRKIGARGGRRTMELHADRYDLIRQRAGASTRDRYGSEHYQQIAARSAQARQAKNALRDHAIQHMLNDGWKVPTLISLTWEDLPRLDKYLSNGLGAYLEEERPDSDCVHLFVSRSGKPLGLANTYAVMKRYQQRQES